MKKSKRQQKIVDLITAGNIATQEELNSHLEVSGFFVNQSSVSRDLDELGIVKVNGFYSLPQLRPAANAFGISTLDTAGDNLIVARCEPGLATAAAVAIDRAKIPDIVGTIAGDDTIFVAVKDRNAQKQTIRRIRGIFDG
jgi:transcriptional regulator of arginine metabolism